MAHFFSVAVIFFFRRWKGGKIRVGFAKGDYLQRLKAEWDAADAKKEEEASAATATAAGGPSKTPVPPALAYKARPFLRLRRRPGERGSKGSYACRISPLFFHKYFHAYDVFWTTSWEAREK